MKYITIVILAIQLVSCSADNTARNITRSKKYCEKFMAYYQKHALDSLVMFDPNIKDTALFTESIRRNGEIRGYDYIGFRFRKKSRRDDEMFLYYLVRMDSVEWVARFNFVEGKDKEFFFDQLDALEYDQEKQFMKQD